jgi:DNA-binding HxlR family transcriptional regulator
VEYHLTDKGRAIDGILNALDRWADKWVCKSDVPAHKVPKSGNR